MASPSGSSQELLQRGKKKARKILTNWSTSIRQQAGNGSVVASGFTADNRVPSYKLTDGNLTTAVTRHLRLRAIDHTAKANPSNTANRSPWTATFPLANGDVQRLDARDGDFSRQWSQERITSISISSTTVVVSVSGVQAVGGKDLFIDASFTIQATGGSVGPLVNAGYAIRRNGSPLSAGGLSASGVGRAAQTPRKGTAAVTYVDPGPTAGTYTYDIQVFGVGGSGVDCQVDVANISVDEGRR